MNITPEELDEMIENHDALVIVDVRRASEFRQAHIPRARNLPLERIEASSDRVAVEHEPALAVPEGARVVLCSQHGERSAQADRLLERLGCRTAYNLVGGIERWQALGFALVPSENGERAPHP